VIFLSKIEGTQMRYLFNVQLVLFITVSIFADSQVDVLQSIFSLPEVVAQSLSSLDDQIDLSLIVQSTLTYNPLFDKYPELKDTLSYISFACYPTPIHRAYHLEEIYNNQCRMYIKQDGLTKPFGSKTFFGGNKVRKLEYLLADAIAQGYSSVLTFGAAGSNHALQTSICADMLGLKTTCLLFPQPTSWVVQRNLLLHLYYNTTLYYCNNRELRGIFAAMICYDHKQRYGSWPYIIPFGGSCEVGVIGYVQAAFELAEQIEMGLMEEPDDIYVTFGSGGTAIGLLLGLQMAGIDSHLYMVVEEPADITRIEHKIERLFYGTNNYLHRKDPAVPLIELDHSRYTIIVDCAGQGYGVATSEGIKAEEILLETENILLDQTYTAKAFSALVRDLEQGKCFDKTILFWNTFCSDSFEMITEQVDFKALLYGLQSYFYGDDLD
jgi:D-cysteine desulfhydrase